MPVFTLDELARLLRSCAGEVGEIELDLSFTDLGYDSLAMMEVASQVELRYGVRIAEEEVAEAESPRTFIDTVNRSIAAAAN